MYIIALISLIYGCADRLTTVAIQGYACSESTCVVYLDAGIGKEWTILEGIEKHRVDTAHFKANLTDKELHK